MITSPACHDHENVIKMLDRQYAEAPEAVGLQANGHLVQVFVSKDGASWTIVTTRPDGLTCIVAAGDCTTVGRVVIRDNKLPRH